MKESSTWSPVRLWLSLEPLGRSEDQLLRHITENGHLLLKRHLYCEEPAESRLNIGRFSEVDELGDFVCVIFSLR
jgi:hypothetical protein